MSQKTKVSDSKAMRGSLHLYLQQVSHEANNQGLTMQDLVKVMKQLEARPNIILLKETFVKPYIKKTFGLDSTEKLDSSQVTETYEALNKLFGYYWDISLPFPSQETKYWESYQDNQ